MPESGPGWDAGNVYLGAMLQTDAVTVGESIGFSAFDFGDQQAYAEAVYEELHASGGLCGRQVVPVYYDLSSVNDTDQAAQEACTLWTQDQRVASASLVPNMNTPNMYGCLADAGVPAITLTGSPSLNASLADYMPYLVLRNTLAWDYFASHWVDRLMAMGYFEPWDTAAGAPGIAPVKVAIVAEDNPIAAPAWEAVKSELERRGITVSDFVLWSDPGQFSGFVLQFRANGVTHLFLDRLAGIFYPSQAQGQGYLARYALTSQNFIQPFLANGPAPRQLRGAMGVGWHPTIDVQADQEGEPAAGFERCMDLMERHGVDVAKRNYQWTATASCDGVEMLRRTVEAGRGVTPDQLIGGMHAAAPTMPWAAMFGAAGRSGEAGLLSVTRDVRYDDACSCMTYSSGDVAIP